MASPRTVRPAWVRAIPLIGWPAKRSRNRGDQATSKPTLEGRKGAMATPASASQGVQAASEPSLAQLAPPRASTTASGRSVRSPSVVSKLRAPSFQPVQRERVRISTPRLSSRASQARSSGEAFIARGKTRPEEPTKVSWPRPSAQAVRSADEKDFSHSATRSRAGAS
ncbi:hypothetical protein D3C86_1507590 [compost metagenome]